MEYVIPRQRVSPSASPMAGSRGVSSTSSPDGQAHRPGTLDRPPSRTMTTLQEEPLSFSSSSQIHFDHPLIRRNLIDGSFGQHRAFVQTSDLDAEFADEGHVMFDDHDGFLAIDLFQKFGGLMGLDVGHAGHRLFYQQQYRILRQPHPDFEPLLLAVRQAPR